MKKKIVIRIPEPCHEGWEKMTPTAAGRFCNSCRKQVIDFSNMSDEQIALHFKHAKGSTCGHFMTHQLDREMDLPKKRLPWIKYFFQVALPAFLVSRSVAQNVQDTNIKGDTTYYDSTGSHELKKGQPGVTDKQISGKVVDENGVGIPYASIFIKGTTIAAATDSAGSFVIKYRDEISAVVLECSSVGYATVEHLVSAPSGQQTIIMPVQPGMLGEVVLTGMVGHVRGGATSGVTVTKMNMLETLMNRIIPSKVEMTIYPNPVQSDALLNFQTRTKAEGYYVFQLAAGNGQVVLKKEYFLAKNDNTVQLQLPALVAGTYFVTMTNKKTNKSISEKIVVLNR